MLDSSSIAISRFLIFDSSRHLLIHQEIGISIYRVRVTFLSFPLYLFRSFLTSYLPKHLSLTPNHFPTQSSVARLISSFGMILLLLFYHAFHPLWPNFWDFWKNLGFFKFNEVFPKFLGWGFCLNDFKSSCIALHLHFNYIFMHYRCVLYMLNCCVLLGLDWAEPMMIFMLHITCSCIFMHTYFHFFIFLYWFVWCFFACLSLSFSLSCVSLLYST